MSFFKLTAEQRKQIAEIIGVENSDKVFDEDAHNQVVESNNSIKQKYSELDRKYSDLSKKRVLNDDEVGDFDEFQEWKRAGKPTGGADLEAQRKTLTDAFTVEKQGIESERDYWKSRLEKRMRDQEVEIAAGGRRVKKTFVKDVVKVLRDQVVVDKVGDEITAVIVDEKGNKRFNSSGDPLTVEELVDEYVKLRPEIVDKDTSSGSGAQGGSGDGAHRKLDDKSMLDSLTADYDEARKRGDIPAMNAIEERRAVLRRKINTKK